MWMTIHKRITDLVDRQMVKHKQMRLPRIFNKDSMIVTTFTNSQLKGGNGSYTSHVAQEIAMVGTP